MSSISMKELFRNFFHPAPLIYTYAESSDVIISKIREILSEKGSLLWSERDFTAEFLSDDTFFMKLNSVGSGGPKFNPVLTGRISRLNDTQTEIEINFERNLVLQITFFISVIFGLAYFTKFMISRSIEFLFWSVGVLLGGTLLSIGFANVGNGAVQERFEMYISKPLRTKA